MSIKKLALSVTALSIALIFASGTAFAAPSVDVTSQKGITVGGKSAAWGGAVNLTEADSFLQSNGKCAFNISYDMENLGDAATASLYKNRLLAAGTLVSEQSALALNAGETKLINTQAYLTPGSYELQLKLDADNNLVESNEANNGPAIKVHLDGKCSGEPKPVPKPDIVSQKGITIGGAVGGAGGKSSGWGGSINLTSADAFLKSGGKCAFNVSYDMENIGAAPTAAAFANRLYAGADIISQQTALSLNAGETKQINTQAYLAPGSYLVRLVIDADANVAESNEANNTTALKVTLDSNCSSATVGSQATTTQTTTQTTETLPPTKKTTTTQTAKQTTTTQTATTLSPTGAPIKKK